MKALIFSLGFLAVAGIMSAQETMPRNTVMVESNIIAMSSISYQRAAAISDKTVLFGGGYIMGTGFGYGSHWIRAETALLSFGPRHFLETGALFLIGINDDSSPGIKLAYRFKGKSGITLTANLYALFNIDPVIMPSLGIGYSF